VFAQKFNNRNRLDVVNKELGKKPSLPKGVAGVGGGVDKLWRLTGHTGASPIEFGEFM